MGGCVLTNKLKLAETTDDKKVLKELAHDRSVEVRATIAKRGLYLYEFVNDKNEAVRVEVANLGKYLNILKDDKSDNVRLAVATQTSEYDYQFKNDKSEYVRAEVAKRGNYIDDLMDDEDWYVRKAACTDHLTEDQMMTSSTDPEYFVRAKAVKVCYENQDKYSKALNRLRKDQNWYVQYAFQEMEIPDEDDRVFQSTETPEIICEAIVLNACIDYAKIIAEWRRYHNKRNLKDINKKRDELNKFFLDTKPDGDELSAIFINKTPVYDKSKNIAGYIQSKKVDGFYEPTYEIKKIINGHYGIISYNENNCIVDLRHAKKYAITHFMPSKAINVDMNKILDKIKYDVASGALLSMEYYSNMKDNIK